MEIKELKKLAKALTLSKNSPELSFSFAGEDGKDVTLTKEAMENTLRDEIAALAKTKMDFEKNKYEIFSLIQENIDLKLPKDVQKFLYNVASVQQFGPKDKPYFNVKNDNGKRRGRKFITKAASAGSYEVFYLGKNEKVVPEITAVGGAAQLRIEDFLNGSINWNDLIDTVTLGIEDRIYDEILACFNTIESRLPAANKATSADFDAANLERVIDTVSAYGDPVICCTAAFARKITEGTDWASAVEKEARRNVGYLARYKGANINIIPQTFVDSTNTTKAVDDSIAYVFPTTENSILYVALQGETQVREVENEDWSTEVQTYKRFGVAAVCGNNIGIVHITSLA